MISKLEINFINKIKFIKRKRYKPLQLSSLLGKVRRRKKGGEEERKMEKKEVLANLVDAKKAAVLRVVLNSSDELYLKEISQKSSVPMSSAFRILQQLVKAGVLERREWKTSKVYSCKKESKGFLKELFTETSEGVQEFLQALRPLPGIENIYLHSDKKGKNMILVIGKNVPNDIIERVASQVRENGQEVNYLTLAREQYEQMLRMGLYPMERKVLK